MKAINEITLYDLMAEELEIWITPNKEFGMTLEINDENDDPLVCATGIHPYAAESFAVFCRDYLAAYESSLKKEAA